MVLLKAACSTALFCIIPQHIELKCSKCLGFGTAYVIKKDKIYFLLLIQLKKMSVWGQFTFDQEKYKIQLGYKLSCCRMKFLPIQPYIPHQYMHVSPCLAVNSVALSPR